MALTKLDYYIYHFAYNMYTFFLFIIPYPFILDLLNKEYLYFLAGIVGWILILYMRDQYYLKILELREEFKQ